MKHALSIGLVVMGLWGCGGDDAATDATTAGSTGAGAGSASSSSGATTSGATTSSGTGGSTGESVTLTMETFTIEPGQEVYKCQNYANPFGGEAVDVARFESHMTPGSHHLLLFYRPEAVDGPLEDCSGLEFAATPYSTQLADDSVAYPPGVAARIQPQQGFRLQSHYLNTTTQPITANITMTFKLAAAGTVTAHAGVLFEVQPNIYVGPNSTETVTRDCTIPFDMNVIKTASHMHRHGSHFLATVGGETLFETEEWSEPQPALFDPPRLLPGGAPLHFECTFVNEGSVPLTFGESADTNEMCILGAAFYPVPDGQTTIGCN
jgi:hypothetical protein